MLSQLTQNLLSIDSDTVPTFSAFLRFSTVANPSIPPIKLLLVQTLITLGELKSPENRQDRSEGEELLRIKASQSYTPQWWTEQRLST